MINRKGVNDEIGQKARMIAEKDRQKQEETRGAPTNTIFLNSYGFLLVPRQFFDCLNSPSGLAIKKTRSAV